MLILFEFEIKPKIYPGALKQINKQTNKKAKKSQTIWTLF